MEKFRFFPNVTNSDAVLVVNPEKMAAFVGIDVANEIPPGNPSTAIDVYKMRNKLKKLNVSNFVSNYHLASPIFGIISLMLIELNCIRWMGAFCVHFANKM